MASHDHSHGAIRVKVEPGVAVVAAVSPPPAWSLPPSVAHEAEAAGNPHTPDASHADTHESSAIPTGGSQPHESDVDAAAVSTSISSTQLLRSVGPHVAHTTASTGTTDDAASVKSEAATEATVDSKSVRPSTRLSSREYALKISSAIGRLVTHTRNHDWQQKIMRGLYVDLPSDVERRVQQLAEEALDLHEASQARAADAARSRAQSAASHSVVKKEEHAGDATHVQMAAVKSESTTSVKRERKVPRHNESAASPASNSRSHRSIHSQPLESFAGSWLRRESAEASSGAATSRGSAAAAFHLSPTHATAPASALTAASDAPPAHPSSIAIATSSAPAHACESDIVAASSPRVLPKRRLADIMQDA